MPLTTASAERFDTVILGAGIAGASLAWQLAQTGAAPRTLLVEREAQPGYHSTGRSAAMYMASYGPSGVRALTRASGHFYRVPPPGFSEVPLLAPRGALYVAMAGQDESLQALHDELAQACPRLARLDAAAALALAPCLRAERLLGALFDPDGMDIDVHALHQGFLRGFRRQGGLLRTGAGLDGVAREGDAWRLRFADGCAVQASRVVLAAGAWAEELGARFGAAPIGLLPRRRSAFTFSAPAGVDVAAWPAVVSVDESWYFKPDAGRLLGSPANADATVPHDVRPEELDIALGIARIEGATQLTIRRPSATWAGLRSFVADGEPVIGWDEACPGLFWLAGQGGYGIQSAAGAAALAAALLAGEPLPEGLRREGVETALFAPGRLRPVAGG
jgi:D-arginine dehydrogenase